MLLGKGSYRAGLNRVSLSFRNRKEVKVRRRAGVAPQATRGKPSMFTKVEFQTPKKFITCLTREITELKAHFR